jgi:hypothetical protein
MLAGRKRNAPEAGVSNSLLIGAANRIVSIWSELLGNGRWWTVAAAGPPGIARPCLREGLATQNLIIRHAVLRRAAVSMMPRRTYREWLRTNSREANPETLTDYLGEIRDEDWNAEFKRAENDIDYGVRRAVASLANHEGGELFIGVNDSDRALSGTRLRKVDLYSRLRQEGPREEWYTLDLAPLAVETTEVQLPDPEKRILVVEVRKSLLPGIVCDDNGKLSWYERLGNSDHELEPVDWVRRLRERKRGKLLLELYREYDGRVRSIPTVLNFVRIDPNLFHLPRYESARADGLVYTTLAEEDRRLLVDQAPPSPGSFSAPGILEKFLRDGAEIVFRAEREFEETGRLTEAVTGNDLRIHAMSLFPSDLSTFVSHVRRLGLLQETR